MGESGSEMLTSLLSHRSTGLVTCAICTYNRSPELQKTLETLVEVTRDAPRPWELLVIDNNSTDDTASVAMAFADRLPLRYVFEPQQGLSHARNRALAEAQSDVIAFTDDDVDVQVGWPWRLYDPFDRDPQVAFVGGRILPAYQGTPPPWFLPYASNLLYGVTIYYDLGNEEMAYSEKMMSFIGANVAFRVNAALEAGGFDPDFGVMGEKRGSGEEFLMIETLAKLGYRGVYVPTAWVRHRIGPSRWTERYIFQVYQVEGEWEISFSFKRRSVGGIPLYVPQNLLRGALYYVIGKILRRPSLWVPSLVSLAKAWGGLGRLRSSQWRAHQRILSQKYRHQSV